MPLAIFSAMAAAFSASMFSAALLDQRDDVAHAEDAVGDAAGMEFLQLVHLLAGADQLDRLAGDGAHRERRAAAAVAVHAGQHEAGDADALVEVAGEVDGVLAGQRIGDQQDFVRVGLLLDLGHLGHQRLVDMGAAGGVEDDDVMAAELGRLHGARGDIDRRLAGDDRQRIDAGLLAELAELLLRGRAARIERGHQDLLACRASVRRLAILPVVVVLPEPCRPTIMMTTGAGALRSIVDALGAEHLDQLVMDDLDDHLAGLDRLQDLGADGLVAHVVGEGADDFERHVGLEQRTAHLAQRRRDIGFRQRATAGQAVQDGAKAVLESSQTSLLPSVPGSLMPERQCFRGENRRKAKKHPRGASRCRVLTSGIVCTITGPGRRLRSL